MVKNLRISFCSLLVVFFACTTWCESAEKTKHKSATVVRTAVTKKVVFRPKLPSDKKAKVVAAPSYIKTLWKKFVDNIPLLEFYGAQKVSPETERFVRGIQKEMGMESYNIPVRRFTDKMIQKNGYENALVTPWRSMYISEDWLNSLPLAQKRFVVGHELAHLKRRHHLKSMGIVLAMSYMNYFIGTSYLENYTHESRWKREARGLGVLAPLELLMFVALSRFDRYCEADADATSVAELKCYKGAIDNFGGPDNAALSKSFADFLAKRPWHEKLKDSFWNLFDSHPRDHERNRNIQKLMATSKKRLKS